MSLRSWKICKSKDEDIDSFAKECGVPRIIAEILLSRGFTGASEVKNFLEPLNSESESNDSVLHGTFELIECVNAAIDNREKICVYGDYDADGITATALVYLYLKSRGADVCYYIPEREKDGYGLNLGAIDYLKSQNVKLIFTVDNGVSAVSEIECANRLGIKTVITDHHKIPEVLPSAVAIVDPHCPENSSFAKNFAGVGVAFKVITAMEPHKKDELFKQYGDFVAIGTVGDSIELFGESRNFVKNGLKIISNSSRPGVRALLNIINSKNSKLTSTDVAFRVVPRINAGGRMGNANLALELLLTDNQKEAGEIAEKLEKLNYMRKSAEEKILASAEELLQEEPNRKYEKVIVVEGKNWHPGVLGIVASRITEKYGKPSVLISIGKSGAVGSCRSVEGFSIYNVVCKCSKALERFGGHPMAAGINLKEENIELFKELMKKATQDACMPVLSLSIDAVLSACDIIPNVPDSLSVLEPFGCANPEPIFGIFGLHLIKISSIGQGKHLKLTLSQNGCKFDALCFCKTFHEFLYHEGDMVDIAVSLYKNEYRGALGVSVKIIDMRLSGCDALSAFAEKKVYEKFKLGKKLSCEEINKLIPSRDDFVVIYKYMRVASGFATRADIMSSRIFGQTVNYSKICIALDVMAELKIADIRCKSDEYIFSTQSTSGKTSLSNSLILKRLEQLKKGNLI